MARTRFVMAPGFERELLSSPAIRQMLEKPTDDVAEVAEELSPFLTGHLHGGIESVVEFDGSRGRWVGRVTSTDFKSIWNEFGTKHSHAQPFLRPALEQVVPGASTVSR